MYTNAMRLSSWTSPRRDRREQLAYFQLRLLEPAWLEPKHGCAVLHLYTKVKTWTNLQTGELDSGHAQLIPGPIDAGSYY